MSVTMKWRNKDRLAAKLKQLAPAADRDIAVANGTSANEMVALAKGFAPRRRGDLIDSIHATPPGAVPPAYSQGAQGTNAWLVTAGNTKVRTAHLVEFGTAPHAQPNNPRIGFWHPGSRAYPFFFPAYRLMRRKHRRRVSQALGKSVKKVAKR